MVDQYLDLETNLIFINELIDKQEMTRHPYIKLDQCHMMKMSILKQFCTKAKFIKECFLSFKNFEPEEILGFLPIVYDIKEYIQATEINKGLKNKLLCNDPDSEHFQTLKIRQLGATHMASFELDTRENFFKNCKPANKSIAQPKGNIPRIKQKIKESEAEGKSPGACYLKDMLRATIYYTKNELQMMQLDLEEFAEIKKGKIVKFVAKSQPF